MSEQKTDELSTMTFPDAKPLCTVSYYATGEIKIVVSGDRELTIDLIEARSIADRIGSFLTGYNSCISDHLPDNFIDNLDELKQNINKRYNLI